jgi:Leucine-rich repeat (LRR) protein
VVPPEIRLMTGLTELFLDDNRLVQIAPELCRLPNILNLQLNNNCISILPDNLLEFTRLKYLGLGKNEFTSFPVRVCDIDSLENLILDENGLTEVPDDIQKLDRLKVFSLAINKLSSLPDAFANMRNRATRESQSHERYSEVPKVNGLDENPQNR